MSNACFSNFLYTDIVSSYDFPNSIHKFYDNKNTIDKIYIIKYSINDFNKNKKADCSYNFVFPKDLILYITNSLNIIVIANINGCIICCQLFQNNKLNTKIFNYCEHYNKWKRKIH